MLKIRKIIYLSAVFLPLVVTSTGSSSVSVNTSSTSQANGSETKVETNITTKVNDTQTTIKTNKAGTIEVNVNNDQVEVKTSKGITPTIIITGSPKVSVQVKEDVEQGSEKKLRPENAEQKAIPSIYNFLKGFFSKLFSSSWFNY